MTTSDSAWQRTSNGFHEFVRHYFVDAPQVAMDSGSVYDTKNLVRQKLVDSLSLELALTDYFQSRAPVHSDNAELVAELRSLECYGKMINGNRLAPLIIRTIAALSASPKEQVDLAGDKPEQGVPAELQEFIARDAKRFEKAASGALNILNEAFNSSIADFNTNIVDAAYKDANADTVAVDSTSATASESGARAGEV